MLSLANKNSDLFHTRVCWGKGTSQIDRLWLERRNDQVPRLYIAKLLRGGLCDGIIIIRQTQLWQIAWTWKCSCWLFTTSLRFMLVHWYRHWLKALVRKCPYSSWFTGHRFQRRLFLQLLPVKPHNLNKNLVNRIIGDIAVRCRIYEPNELGI